MRTRSSRRSAQLATFKRQAPTQQEQKIRRASLVMTGRFIMQSRREHQIARSATLNIAERSSYRRQAIRVAHNVTPDCKHKAGELHSIPEFAVLKMVTLNFARFR